MGRNDSKPVLLLADSFMKAAGSVSPDKLRYPGVEGFCSVVKGMGYKISACAFVGQLAVVVVVGYCGSS